jgi:hypothetical protein
MSVPVAIQGIALYVLLSWKAWHLSRAPRALPLRCVTASLACAAVAYPFGIAVTLRPASAAAPWLMALQNAFLLGMSYGCSSFRGTSDLQFCLISG